MKGIFTGKVFCVLDAALHWRNALVVFCVVAAAATSVKLVLGLAGNERDAYNNVLIFRASFVHLWEGSNLYRTYPSEHNDLFKYSPTFALLAAPMAIMPAALAAALWNALNSAVFIVGVNCLSISGRKKAMLLWITLVEVTTSLQNFQSNLLVAGFFLVAYTALERQQWMQAMFWVVLLASIKLYGAVVVMFCLPVITSAFRTAREVHLHYVRALVGNVFMRSFQPIFSLGGWFLCWLVLFGIAPIVIVGWRGLITLHQQWLELLRTDHAISVGMSFFGFVALWMPTPVELNWKSGVLAVQVLTLVISCLPLMRKNVTESPALKLLIASSLLLWMVVFNHKAESPTYCIALLGVGLWYIADVHSTDSLWHRYKGYALWLIIVLTSLSVTDIVPLWIREEWIATWNIKALPCSLLWFVVQWQVWQKQRADQISPPTSAVA
jgi:hypothetical protein